MACSHPDKTVFSRLDPVYNLQLIGPDVHDKPVASKTACQTPSILRQAAYECRRSEHLHDNPVLELPGNIGKWALLASTSVDTYSSLGIHRFIAQCESVPGATVHVNATGSVISRIPGEKTDCYYSMLMADSNRPVMDILSSCHEATWIHRTTLRFSSSVRQVCRHWPLLGVDACLYPSLQRGNAAGRTTLRFSSSVRQVCRHWPLLSICSWHTTRWLAAARMHRLHGVRRAWAPAPVFEPWDSRNMSATSIFHIWSVASEQNPKIFAGRCQILRLKCTKFNFGWGFPPDPTGGAYSAPQTLAGFKGPTSKGAEGKWGEGTGLYSPPNNSVKSAPPGTLHRWRTSLSFVSMPLKALSMQLLRKIWEH